MTIPYREKRCIACGLVRPIEEFARSGRRHRQPRCNTCREEARERRGRNGRKQIPCAYCSLCCGLAHRVEGPMCRECGLRYAEQEPVVISPWQQREDPVSDYC